MEHVVFHSGPDEAPAFRRVSSLDEAVRFVEHLRNVEGVEDASVHLLTPVPLAFRAYYKVEVPAVDTPAVDARALDAPVVPAQPVAVEAVPEPVAVEAVPVEGAPVEAMTTETVPADAPVPVEPAASANGKRSLGFFAH